MTRKNTYNCDNSANDLCLSKAECKSTGAFHTPKKLALEMAKKLYPDYIKCKSKTEIIETFGDKGRDFLADFNLIDPCCGTGNLLAAAMNVYKWIDEEDLYGVDIDERAVQFCKHKFPCGHFQVGDCLLEDLTDDKFWQAESDGLFGRTKALQLAAAKLKIKNKTKKTSKQIELLQNSRIDRDVISAINHIKI